MGIEKADDVVVGGQENNITKTSGGGEKWHKKCVAEGYKPGTKEYETCVHNYNEGIW